MVQAGDRLDAEIRAAVVLKGPVWRSGRVIAYHRIVYDDSNHRCLPVVPGSHRRLTPIEVRSHHE